MRKKDPVVYVISFEFDHDTFFGTVYMTTQRRFHVLIHGVCNMLIDKSKYGEWTIVLGTHLIFPLVLTIGAEIDSMYDLPNINKK